MEVTQDRELGGVALRAEIDDNRAATIGLLPQRKWATRIDLPGFSEIMPNPGLPRRLPADAILVSLLGDLARIGSSGGVDDDGELSIPREGEYETWPTRRARTYVALTLLALVATERIPSMMSNGRLWARDIAVVELRGLLGTHAGLRRLLTRQLAQERTRPAPR
ncbi:MULTISPECIES: hypothetical protein [Microbacterium]|uniref:Uncharacterized protein n=1 Tax=Microbacterium trichothecenolyticum TaxID=69370 RepID=A0A0M2HFJ9_MICTR|nr:MULTISPECIES: hypothetical protein [Microbacterium]KJL45447.1 hypothetical protein RS82_00218 [Microbacterium trichothecenolyticum]MDR7188431.1 hypothetical protein [Microbacterium sp. BE35]